MMYKNSNLNSFYLLGIFVCSFYFMFILYFDYLMNLSVALLLCVASFWVKTFIKRYIKNNLISSLLSVIVLFAILVIPLFFIIYELVNFIPLVDFESLNAFIENSKIFIYDTLERFPKVKESMMEFLAGFSASSILNHTLNLSSMIGKKSLSIVTNTAFILIFLFMFFYYGERIYRYLLTILPFSIEQSNTIFLQVANILRMVFISSALNVALQGIIFGIVASCFGYNGIFFGIAYGVCSLVPLVGGSLVWLPLASYEFYLGNTANAIIISLISMILLATIIDNFLRPFLIMLINKTLKIQVKINEMLIFFSIIAGLSSFGVWGIIIGPAITTFFIALLQSYKTIKENEKDDEKNS